MKIALNHQKISQVQQCNSPIALSIEEDNEYYGLGQKDCQKSRFAPTVESIVNTLKNNTLNDKFSYEKVKPKTISTNLSLVITEDENEENEYNTQNAMKDQQKDRLRFSERKTSLDNFLFDEEAEIKYIDSEKSASEIGPKEQNLFIPLNDEIEDATHYTEDFKNKKLWECEVGYESFENIEYILNPEYSPKATVKFFSLQDLANYHEYDHYYIGNTPHIFAQKKKN